ncbi:PVC-type heme-binding CxxCH protein [Cyclobacterium qasimii]|nr:PVC-type heme-binding CxxCH protein [Cyclobacterium qasimii]
MHCKLKNRKNLLNYLISPRNWSIMTCFALLLACQQEKATLDSPPKFEIQKNPVNSPQYTYADSVALKTSMAAFQLEPGLQIDLIAADPLVADPSAFAFDEKGILYVAENTGYPDPMDGKKPDTLGKISRLVDSDGDGKYDQRSVFVEGLTYPNGIMAWKGGVFVTCAPHIYYFKDTTGDGKADIQEIVLTGFNANRTAQIRTSHPTLGLDGWIYVTSGLNGGEVYSPAHPERKPVSFNGADGRFNPETLEFQLRGGKSQFGLAFDAFGRRYGSSNRHPLQHIVMEPDQLSNNPNLLFNKTIEDVAPAEAEGFVYPISKSITTADYIPKLMGLSHQGTFTSACGTLIFESEGLHEAHKGNAFICEPAQNLVQRQSIKENGATFISERVHEDWEFLSSSDSWFNPVFLSHGPKGAMYLADMYRKVIDHPSYVPEETRGALDFESGKGKGKIYRITRDNLEYNKVETVFPTSSAASMDMLITALSSDDEWERNTAFRLILEKMPQEAIAPLKEMVLSDAIIEGKVKAIWLLHHFDGLDDKMLTTIYDDNVPIIREQIIAIIALKPNISEQLASSLIKGATDTNPRVRYMTALTFGGDKKKEWLPYLAKIAQEDASDPWTRAAVMTALNGQEISFLNILEAEKKQVTFSQLPMWSELGELIGSSVSAKELTGLIDSSINSEWDNPTFSLLLGLLKGSERHVKGSEKTYLDAYTKSKEQLDALVQETTKRASSAEDSLTSRIQATALLSYFSPGETEASLKELISPNNPPEIQLAAIQSLGNLNSVEAGEILIETTAWKAYTPKTKGAVIATMVSRPILRNQLLMAIEESKINPAEISSSTRLSLMKASDSKVRSRAEDLFKELESGGRMKVYEEHKRVLDIKGNAANGEGIFKLNCATCHTYAGEGGDVGPDLSGINNQPALALLLHTIVPNYEVFPGYQAITVTTHEGKQVTGRIAAESANSLSLRTAYGTEENILRTQIKSIQNPGLSLMPNGLEQNMTDQEMADLLAYLKGAQ